MSIKVTFEFEAAEDAYQFFSKNRVPPVAAQAPVEAQIKVPVPVAEKPAKPKVTAKAAPPVPPATAATPPVPPAATAAAPSEPPTVTAGTPAGTGSAQTINDVRSALSRVFNKPGGTGAVAATTLLKKYGANSVSQVKPEDYAKFIKDCA